ncbi:DUF5694 domain-containing protein [Chryseobacterium sp. NRRL B-14859]|uniref:DUF5694 domain-containing protein n=1 Tax=Chryseobacterium sp. NRRL B-14859 TaxID=1562763 RepID=UPI0033955786
MNIAKIVVSFCFSIALSVSASAQEKIRILVLGTSHYNQEKDSAEQKRVIEKLVGFNPDMVMGEFVSPEEYLSLEQDSYRRKMNDSTFFYYQKLNADIRFSEKKLEKDANRLIRFPNLHRSRIELAVGMLNNYDLANAKYQIYMLETWKKSHFNPEEAAFYKKRLGGTETLVQHNLYQSTSEYNTIIFPLMQKLNLSTIYPVDCQIYDTKWTQAWRIVAYCMHFINRIAKMDENSEEARIVHKIEQEKKRIYSKSDSLGLQGYAYLNSSFNAEESDLINFYGGEKLFGFSKNYPEKEVREMIKYWKLRNEGMAANIIRLAREKKGKRIVIAAGSAHQKWIADILRKEPDVDIIDYNTL